MNIMAKCRQMAKEHFLHGVSFFDKDGKIGARGNDVDHIELEFSNGEKINMTPKELAAVQNGCVFHLEKK